MALKNNLESKGITIVSNNIVVSGEVNVTNKEGQSIKIPVAGTLDLLGYDANGDFYIFDIKTVHNLLNGSKLDTAKKIQRRHSKWSR
jgi:hypothetical protein